MARRRLAPFTAIALPLALLALTLGAGVAAGGGGCHAQLERDAAETTVRMTGSCFDPMIARVPVGSTVRFVNEDGYAHVVVGATATWGNFNELGEGDSVAWRFTQSGVYPYACHLHPSMIGAIVVGDGGPGATGHSVQQVKGAGPAATTAAIRTTASAEPTEAAAAGASPTVPPAEPVGATGLLTIGLIAVLLGAGAAYGFGWLPGVPKPRTRSR